MGKLMRSPGVVIVAGSSLVATKPKEVADANGYYQSLGLSPGGDWSQDDVKRAYWSRAKKLHPDGSDPDTKEFARVQAAYAVLSDPESRRRYDALDPESWWIDEEVVAALLKRWSKAKEVNPKEVATVLKQASRKGDSPQPPPPPPRNDGIAYYYYEGEEVPSQELRNRWAACVVQVVVAAGIHGEVHLGFTEGDPHLVQKQWGKVLMVSGEPSLSTVQEFVGILRN